MIQSQHLLRLHDFHAAGASVSGCSPASNGRRDIRLFSAGATGPGYFLRSLLNVGLLWLNRDFLQIIVDNVHDTCPYSTAARENIDVTVTRLWR
jgi:hypothetical protein